MLLLNKKIKKNDFCLLKYSTHMIETINFISGYRNDENSLFFTIDFWIEIFSKIKIFYTKL